MSLADGGRIGTGIAPPAPATDVKRRPALSLSGIGRALRVFPAMM